MVKLGSEKRPIIVRVYTEDRGRYVAETCTDHGWHYIIGFEPDKPEDISDLEKALNPHNRLSHKRREEMIRACAVAEKNSKSAVGQCKVKASMP